jgi:hypothetical protein
MKRKNKNPLGYIKSAIIVAGIVVMGLTATANNISITNVQHKPMQLQMLTQLVLPLAGTIAGAIQVHQVPLKIMTVPGYSLKHAPPVPKTPQRLLPAITMHGC